MKKKLFGLLLSGILCITMLAGCGEKEPVDADSTDTTQTAGTGTESGKASGNQAEEPLSEDPLEMITQGYYTYSYFVEGYGQFDYFFHFYKEDPVLGAVFYAGFCNNQINYVGTYTVEEKEKEYTCAPDRDKLIAKELVTGTAPYTVTFYDWQGNELGSCGYDGEVLYNDLASITGTGSENCYYYHDTQGEASKYAKTYEGELGMTYLDFTGEEDDTCTVTLFHNMTYRDMVGMIVEGSWTMAANGQGGYDYTLTPFASSDTAAVLSVSADQMSAVYTPEGGVAMNMTNSVKNAAQLAYLFEGTATLAQYGVDAMVTLNAMDDGTCTLDADVFGNQATLDNGTYEMTNEYTFAFTFEKAGELESVIDFETTVITLAYKGTTDVGELDVKLVLNTDAAQDTSAAEILFSFTGTFCTLDILADNTYKFAFPDYNLEETGAWNFDGASYQFTLTQSNGNEIAGQINTEDNSLNLTYTSEASADLSDTFTCDAQTWGSALVAR